MYLEYTMYMQVVDVAYCGKPTTSFIHMLDPFTQVVV